MLNQRDCSLPFCFCCIFSRSCQFKCLAYNIELVTLILIHILHTIYLSPIWCVCSSNEWMNEWIVLAHSLTHSFAHCLLGRCRLSVHYYGSIQLLVHYAGVCPLISARTQQKKTPLSLDTTTRHNDDGLLDERNSSRKRRRQTKQNNWKRFIIID